MRSEDIVPLPEKFISIRNQLRVVNYDLVRYTESAAKKEANRYRHPKSDYEYAIHKINNIDEQNWQVYISRHVTTFVSENRVVERATYYINEEKPEWLSVLKSYFFSPLVILVILALPYFMAILVMIIIGQYAKKNQQESRKKELFRLSDIPKFQIN